MALRGQPVTYRFWCDGTLLYIGQTTDFERRIVEHAAEKKWWPYVTHYRVEEFPSPGAAISAEAAAIRDELPVFNIAGNRGDVAGRQRAFWKQHGTAARAGWQPSYDRAIRVFTTRYGSCLPIGMTLPPFVASLRVIADGS